MGKGNARRGARRAEEGAGEIDAGCGPEAAHRPAEYCGASAGVVEGEGEVEAVVVGLWGCVGSGWGVEGAAEVTVMVGDYGFRTEY